MIANAIVVREALRDRITYRHDLKLGMSDRHAGVEDDKGASPNKGVNHVGVGTVPDTRSVECCIVSGL